MSATIEKSLDAHQVITFNTEETLASILYDFENTAIKRDLIGGHAKYERDLIRNSGLLTYGLPKKFGGYGASWSDIYGVVRKIAQVDSALAHIYAFHNLQLTTIALYGDEKQYEAHAKETIVNQLFWGNALNPNDKRAIAKNIGDGYQINGPKSYCSGSVGSDRLIVSAWHEPSQSLLFAAIPSNRAGVTITSDWDAFGQKQTDSGTVLFNDVQIEPHEILVEPGRILSNKSTVRSLIAQHILTTLYTGIAQGALKRGADYIRKNSRPYFDSGVAKASDDPYIQNRFGKLQTKVRAAELVSDHTSKKIDEVLKIGDELSSEARGLLAITVAESKVIAHEAAIEASNQIFELMGASSTSAKFGLDRFWRNARVHTLHDPIDYKLRDIGIHALTDRVPTPTSYS